MGERFSAPVQIGPGAHPASCAMGTWSFPRVESGRGLTLTPHPLLVPRSKKQSRAIPLLSLRAFVAYELLFRTRELLGRSNANRSTGAWARQPALYYVECLRWAHIPFRFIEACVKSSKRFRVIKINPESGQSWWQDSFTVRKFVSGRYQLMD
jgi:hypothetical protein